MNGAGAREPDPRSRRALRRVLRALLVGAVVALLAIFARAVDWADAWSSVRQADPRWLVAALVANLVSIFLKGVRWWVFLRAIGVDRFALAQRATFAGAGLNNVLVANGGEAARVVFVARASATPGSAVLATLAVERAFDLLGYVILLAGATLALPLPPSVARWRWVAVGIAALALALAGWFVRRARSRSDRDSIELVWPEGDGLRARAGRARIRFGAAFAATAGVARYSSAIALSLAAWGLQLATFAWTARAAGLELPLAGHFATLLTVNLGFLVRITPGNVGVFQLTYALAAVQFAADRDAAIAVALLIQTLQVIPITLLGVALAPEFILRRRVAAP
jgi:uncharacterized protein (TIRG00374 family)